MYRYSVFQSNLVKPGSRSKATMKHRRECKITAGQIIQSKKKSIFFYLRSLRCNNCKQTKKKSAVVPRLCYLAQWKSIYGTWFDTNNHKAFVRHWLVYYHLDAAKAVALNLLIVPENVDGPIFFYFWMKSICDYDIGNHRNGYVCSFSFHICSAQRCIYINIFFFPHNSVHYKKNKTKHI